MQTCLPVVAKTESAPVLEVTCLVKVIFDIKLDLGSKNLAESISSWRSQ